MDGAGWKLDDTNLGTDTNDRTKRGVEMPEKDLEKFGSEKAKASDRSEYRTSC